MQSADSLGVPETVNVKLLTRANITQLVDLKIEVLDCLHTEIGHFAFLAVTPSGTKTVTMAAGKTNS